MNASRAELGVAAPEALLPTYARDDLTIVSGEACRVRDADGRAYLDLAAGIAVVGLGHVHPAPLAAATAQLERLWHASNLWWTEPMTRLASLLSDRFGGARAFFGNSGAEAVEAALKYARKATGRPGVVAVEGSFHGRTLGALSVTGQPGKRAAFEPLLPSVTFVPLNDAEALRAAITEEVGLVLVEPIQGEGGVHPVHASFLAAARDTEALLCLDEIQCGLGRTGSFFAWEQLGVKPDLVTLAKGLANGLPIGALLAAEGIPVGFEPGDHGSTFGGNPVVSAAAAAVVEAIDDELMENVSARGEQLAAGLAELPGVLEVRGRGLLLGAELDRPVAGVVETCRDRGVLVLSAGPNVLRLTPPLVLTEADAAEGLEVIGAALAA
jgi:acetylornithine/N-succinyldiaminopimelate aminotransferase